MKLEARGDRTYDDTVVAAHLASYSQAMACLSNPESASERFNPLDSRATTTPSIPSKAIHAIKAFEAGMNGT